MILIPMTDFILQRSSKDISKYTITETFKDGAKIMNEIFAYAKFLKKPITLKMFNDGEIYFNEKATFLKETDTDFIFTQFGWKKTIHKGYRVEDLIGRGLSLYFNESIFLL